MTTRLPVLLRRIGFTMTTVICLACAPSAQAAAIMSGPVVNPSNGHTYYLLTSDFWEASEAAAAALGGHLVTVNDQAENDWVFDTFSMFDGQSRTLWTGYHRLVAGGPFVWSSGETPGFENWYPGEPNNFTGAEDYAAFVPTAQDAGKKWFDMYAATTYFNTPIHGVVEVTDVVAVPEPASLALISMGMLGLLRSRLRRKRHTGGVGAPLA